MLMKVSRGRRRLSVLNGPSIHSWTFHIPIYKNNESAFSLGLTEKRTTYSKMQSTILSLFLVLAFVAIGHAFAPQSANSRTTSTALFGKRQAFKNNIKKLFGKSEEPTATKVKLSNAKGMAKKLDKIDDLEEKTYQMLKDLKMVGSN
uniref:Uncharacterized protein n=1 Tax=Pseudo-nitzschia arenysensis TaxID=697910 RepID=A0A7S0F760_9STRA|mmetsp:Transcript_157/g.357  ORF Transcript_157/g.357 Transcript_157/m.357 type:complete len:147 (+) Transcript_157:37-477(+)